MNAKIIIVTCLLLFSIMACNLTNPGGEGGNGIVVVPLTASPPATNACNNTWLPVTSNATWSYHVTNGPTGDFDYSTQILDLVPDAFNEMSIIGSVAQTIGWQCTPAGLVVLKPVTGPSASVLSPVTFADFTTTGMSGVTIPNVISPGDQWTQIFNLHGEHTNADGSVSTSDGTYTNHFTATGVENVTVPNGTFLAMRIDIVANLDITAVVSNVPVPVHTSVTATTWYASGIGMVKTISNVEGLSSTVELVTSSFRK
jgi:hypothetical protein